MLGNRAKRESGEEGQGADDQNDRHQEAREQEAVGREGSWPRGHGAFAAHGTRNGHDRDHHEEATEQHGDSESRVPPGRVRIEPGKRRTVISRAAGIGIEHFGESMRPGVVQRSNAAVRHQRNRGAADDAEGGGRAGDDA